MYILPDTWLGHRVLCPSFISVAVIKYPDRRQLREHLTHNPRLTVHHHHEEVKAETAKDAEKIRTYSLAYLISASFSSVLDSLLREWCCPQHSWPSYVNEQSTRSPTEKPIGQPELGVSHEGFPRADSRLCHVQS